MKHMGLKRWAKVRAGLNHWTKHNCKPIMKVDWVGSLLVFFCFNTQKNKIALKSFWNVNKSSNLILFYLELFILALPNNNNYYNRNVLINSIHNQQLPIMKSWCSKRTYKLQRIWIVYCLKTNTQKPSQFFYISQYFVKKNLKLICSIYHGLYKVI